MNEIVIIELNVSVDCKLEGDVIGTSESGGLLIKDGDENGARGLISGAIGDGLDDGERVGTTVVALDGGRIVLKEKFVLRCAVIDTSTINKLRSVHGAWSLDLDGDGTTSKADGILVIVENIDTGEISKLIESTESSGDGRDKVGEIHVSGITSGVSKSGTVSDKASKGDIGVEISACGGLRSGACVVSDEIVCGGVCSSDGSRSKTASADSERKVSILDAISGTGCKTLEDGDGRDTGGVGRVDTSGRDAEETFIETSAIVGVSVGIRIRKDSTIEGFAIGIKRKTVVGLGGESRLVVDVAVRKDGCCDSVVVKPQSNTVLAILDDHSNKGTIKGESRGRSLGVCDVGDRDSELIGGSLFNLVGKIRSEKLKLNGLGRSKTVSVKAECKEGVLDVEIG